MPAHAETMDDREFYQHNVQIIHGFFMAKTFDRFLAEDLTSQVFLRTYEQFGNPSLVIGDRQKYLYGVMRLVWLQHLRAKYASLEQSVDDIEAVEAAVPEEFEEYAVGTIQRTLELSLIERALPYIGRLPEKQRAVMLLRFRDGLALAEICRQLGKDMNYVKTTQRRGLAGLKRMVEGGDDA